MWHSQTIHDVNVNVQSVCWEGGHAHTHKKVIMFCDKSAVIFVKFCDLIKSSTNSSNQLSSDLIINLVAVTHSQ